MAKMYYEKDCDLGKLDGKKIGIIGFGSQGHAHAMNLKDSGCDVCVGLRAGSKNWAKAEEAGLKVMTVAETAKWADIVMILVNDEVQADLEDRRIAQREGEDEFDARADGLADLETDASEVHDETEGEFEDDELAGTIDPVHDKPRRREGTK